MQPDKKHNIFLFQEKNHELLTKYNHFSHNNFGSLKWFDFYELPKHNVTRHF